MFRIWLPATGHQQVTIKKSHKKKVKGKSGGFYLTYFSTLPTLPIVPTLFRHPTAPLPRKETERYHKSIHSIHFPLPLSEIIKFLLFTLRCQCTHLQWHRIVVQILNFFTSPCENADGSVATESEIVNKQKTIQQQK